MRIRGLLAGAVAAATLAAAPAALAAVEDSQEIRDEVTLGGIIEHEQKLAQIAAAHQNNRAAGTVGYDQSVAYVAKRLEDAGYNVHLSPFDFPTWEEDSTPILSQVTPTPTDYVAGGPDDDDSADVDFITFEFSASGDVTAPVIPTNDIVIPPDPSTSTSTSGCESTDFPPETAGAISLIQRGVCTFVEKLDNAAAAGAAGVILFNEGQTGRTNALFRGASPHYPIPAVGSSFEVGSELYEAFQAGENPTARLKVDATTNSRAQQNVIADSTWGEGRSVVVGGHLDSVPAGPGINDNGSGVATILETAEELSELHTRTEEATAAAQTKVDDAQAAVDEAKTAVDDANTAVNDAKGPVDDAKAAVDQSSAKLDQAKAKVKKAKRKLEQADSEEEVRNAERKLDKAKDKRKEAKDDKSDAEAELAAAEAALATAQVELTAAEAALAAAEAALTAAQAELSAAEEQFVPQQKLRIAFWGAEEAGLIGSTQYVAQLTEAEREQILLNLNFDMLGSPNFVRFVYDGNTDETPPPEGGAPPGSDQIEQVFLDYFTAQGLATEPTAFDGRSDYGPFIAQGIPAGGLFSGAEVHKTAEEVGVYGGVEDEQYDPCYHADCDTFDSVFGAGPPGLPGLAGNGAISLEQMSDAAVHSTYHYLTEEDPLGGARVQDRPDGEQPYRLPYRGPEPTNAR